MADIPLDKAELLALFLETLLYGIFFTLFCITIWVLFKKRPGAKTNRLLLVTAITMFLLATMHITIDFVRIVEAFVTYRDQIPEGPIGYYSDVSRTLHVVKSVFYAAQTLIGDTLIVWRCYVLYRKNKYIVMFPALTLVASVASGYMIIWSLKAAAPGSTIFETATAWITTWFVLTLCTNIYCTTTIVYRIWETSRSTAAYRQHSLVPVLLAVVESAGLYSSALLALLIAYLSGSNGQYPALDVVTPLVGIVFSLIIIQISLRSSGVNNTSIQSTTAHRSPAQRCVASTVSGYPLQPISVEITRSTTTDDMVSSALIVHEELKQQQPKQLWNAS